MSFKWEPCPDNETSSLLTGYKIYNWDTLVASVSHTVIEFTINSTVSTVSAGEQFMISISSVSVIGEGHERSLATEMWAVEVPSAITVTLANTT